jgi:hypothetical protein
VWEEEVGWWEEERGREVGRSRNPVKKDLKREPKEKRVLEKVGARQSVPLDA